MYGFRYGACNLVHGLSIRTNYIVGYDAANGGAPPSTGSNAFVVYTSSNGLSLGNDYGPTGFSNGMVTAGENQATRSRSVPIWIRTANGSAIAIEYDDSPWLIEHATEGTLRFRPNGFAGGLEFWGPLDMFNGISELRYNGTRVVGSRQTGWAAATGTATRTTFATSTVTTEQLAQRVKGLIDDLMSHGLLGA